MAEPKLRFKRDDGTEYPKWEETELGEIGEVAMCKRILKEQTSEFGDVPFFKISTFGGTPDAFISYQLFDEFKRKYRFPQKGAILISAAGTVGKTVRYNGENAYYQDSNIVWLEHNDSVSDDFLYQFYQQVTWDSLEGSTIKRLYNKNLLETAISLPCLEEQQIIADFLSLVDEVIAQSEVEVANLERQKKAAMQQIFSQEIRFKRDDGIEYPEWEEKLVSEICEPHARIGWQNLRTDEFLDEGEYYLVTGTDFQNGRVNFDTCHYIDKIRYEQDKNIQIKNGDILITKDGTLGKIALVENMDKAGTLNAGVFVLQNLNKEVYNIYLFQYLMAPYLLNFAFDKSTGGTIKHLNQGILVQFPIPIPCLEEQQKIADFLTAFDDAIRYAKQELAKWKELKKGLLQQMFV